MYTISKENSISGITLHSGELSEIIVSKGEPGSGIIFNRTDVNQSISAYYDNVKNSDLSTSLTKNDISISTVEHFMAACSILNVTDIILSVNCSELPILDGSAILFVDFIVDATLIPINYPVKKVEILKEVIVTNNNSTAMFIPNKKTIYDVQSDFEFYSGNAKWKHNSENTLEILSSRTFGKASDLEYLRSIGLAMGASLENVIGIGDDFEILNKFGLRSENEIANHKLLDAIGDLYLMGYQFIGEFIGYRTGHKLNNKLLIELFSDKDNYKIVEIDSGL